MGRAVREPGVRPASRAVRPRHCSLRVPTCRWTCRWTLHRDRRAAAAQSARWKRCPRRRKPSLHRRRPHVRAESGVGRSDTARNGVRGAYPKVLISLG